MADEPLRDTTERSKELLLADHRYFADSFWRNEEAGERRVNFFITLVTAVLAALVALATKRGSLSDGQIGGIAFAACLGVLAVGILTFRRLIHRNLVTDQYKGSMDHIRNRFRAWDPRGLADYDPFATGTGGARSFGRGGLSDAVAALNSVVVAAALAALAALSGSGAAIAAVATVSFFLALATHAAYLEYSYHGTWLPPLWRRLLSSWWKPREVESSLVVISDTPEDVLQAIEGLKKVAGHALGPARSLHIRDRYVDTSDRELEQREIALRVRELDGRMLVTLKGRSETGRWGGESRFELEREWSDRTWQKVWAKLERWKVATTSAPPTGDSSALEPTLAKAGLEIVQDREVERRVRDVRPRRRGQGRVAELALDTVVYHFPGRDVRHYEVEIEAKARQGAEAVAAVAEALVAGYWPWLRPWRPGKLATGKAVLALLGESRANDLVGDDGALKPQVYDLIAEIV